MNKEEELLAEEIMRGIAGKYVWEQCYHENLALQIADFAAHWGEDLMREVRALLLQHPEQSAEECVEALVCALGRAGLSCGERHSYL